MNRISEIDTGRLRRIEGRHNALLKQLRKTFGGGELTDSGECAIEGFRMIEEALRSGLKLRAVFFSESAIPRVPRLLPQIGSQVETLLVPDKLFASVVPSQSPQGVAALVHLKTHSLEDILERFSSGVMLIIAGVQDPGNLGTILRSAEAFGGNAVLLGEGTVSAFNSKVARASAGSLFRVPVARVQLSSVIGKLRTSGIRLLATSSHKGTNLPDSDLRGPVAIFIGNEGAGIDKKLLSEMDERVMIPHSPKVESLNAGVAASIVLYESARQRT